MARTRRLALSLTVLAACFLQAPDAGAVIPSGNLVLNPGAEDGPGAPDSSQIIPPPQWTVTGGLTAVQYGAAGGYPSTAVGTSISGAANFFSGGNTPTSTGEQVIDVSGAAAEIDGGAVVADLSAYLGGYDGQDDRAMVVAAFRDGAGTESKTLQVGPVTLEERSGQADTTTLLPRSIAGTVPAGTRSIRVTLTAIGVQGTFNDGYADNINLSLAQGTALPPPTIGKTANAQPDKGKVLVRLPNGGGFIALEDARQIPVGTTFDTTKGTVKLTTAAGGTDQEGLFSGGMFVLQQTKKNPLTTLSMAGGGLNRCGTRLPQGGAGKTATGAASRRRTLFSNVKGRFRTRGRNSAATVRGTQWRMTDSCAGTLTTVQKGSVVVHDFNLRKNKTVTAGHKYLARSVKKRKKRLR